MNMHIHDFIYTFVSSFMALFPVINPISSGFIVNGFLEGLNKDQKHTIIKKIILNCLLIGLGSLLVGHLILLIFNLAIPVIQLGGGILICKTGLEWLSGTGTTNLEDKQKTINDIHMNKIKSQVFYPISFPISIGPGSISVIFTLMANASEKGDLVNTSINYSIIALVIIVMCIILYILFTQGSKVMNKLGNSGNLIINKLVAFFTFCVGIQIIVTGISKIFHIHIL